MLHAKERERRLEELAVAERALLEEKRRIAAERRALGGEDVEDHVLVAADGSPLRLSEAFGDRSDLLLIHNMGRRCAWCTLWADGFQGLLPHLSDRSALLLVSPDPPDVMREFAASRGWTFPLASHAGTDFSRRLGYEDDEGRSLPGASGLLLTDGEITRTARAFFGPGDDFCSVWHLLDLLADGDGGWSPRFEYAEKTSG